MEEECLSRKVRKVRIPTYLDVRCKVLRAFRDPVTLSKGVRKKGMVKHLAKIDRVYKIVDEVFQEVLKLPSPEHISEFYAEILKIGGITDYADILNKFKGLRRVLRRIWREYRLKVKVTLDSREANSVAREFVGRALSIVRKLDRELRLLQEASSELKKLPCIREDQPKIVVAGMPQVGKSTLIKTLSSAEPEISPFPFTTKDIILGHRSFNHLTAQFIDTPGILDRPFSELNRIELKALTAIRFLADILLYLIDPRPQSYYSLEEQLDLLKSLQSVFHGTRIIVLINKADDVPHEQIPQILDEVRKSFSGEIYVISALTGLGLEEVLNRLNNMVKGLYRTLQ